MRITVQPIVGIHFGFEFYDAIVDDNEVGYCLIDLFVIRIQIAWYKE